MNDAIKAYKMTTYTLTGQVFKTGVYKTKKTMRSAKERQNLQYGAHLRAEVVALDVYGNALNITVFCLRSQI